MFSELFELIGLGIKKVLKSRLFVIAVLFSFMFVVLVVRLFRLQILQGESYQDNYVQKIEKTVQSTGTRGRILDRNGNVLAYDRLAYAITIGDTGIYKNGYEKNKMLLRLIPILDQHGVSVRSSLSLAIDESGRVNYTTGTEEERLRFLRDVYGRSSVDELDQEDGKYPSNVSGNEIFEYLKEHYGVGYNKNGSTYEVDDATALKILHIRYAQTLNAYRKYDTIVIAEDVDLETVADIMEHEAELKEIQVEEKTVRVYNDSFAFAHILGYTGVVSESQLEQLLTEDDTYTATDVVGKAGIESAMETTLSGEKGKETLYVDSEGRVLETADKTDAKPGDDVYLTIDRNLQVGLYAMIEQDLASIVISHLTNDPDYVVTEKTDASAIKIPARDAYFQFINNNLLSMSAFGAEDATSLQRSIYDRFSARLAAVLPELRAQLTSPAAPAFEKCSDAMQDYQDYVYDYMRDKDFFLSGALTAEDEIYVAWVNETNSFYEFLHHCVESGFIDSTKLTTDLKYTTTEDTYTALVDTLLSAMKEDKEFHKLVYKYLIKDDGITGCELCLCLYEQGVLQEDEAWISRLKYGTREDSFAFLKEKIGNLELTPAQMALDPCSASCVLTDVNTGEVLALVTYPGYDNNRFSGSIDTEYYYELYNDKSQPFLNRATQVETAPGSIFKVLTTCYGLEEGVITRDETMFDTGSYDTLGLHLKCWKTDGHQDLSVVTAIAQSCNYFFSEVGYRISLDENGQYDAKQGIATIQKYCSMFGLTEKSGVEITESSPNVTDENPIPSSIGQGTHAYACIHLSRYLTTVASSGNLYKYSLISKVQASDGTVLKEYETQIEQKVNLSQSTWDAMHDGMEAVIGPPGTYYSTFLDSEVRQNVGIAGKSGTAEQSKGRANHATFMGYAPAPINEGDPYVEPEVAVAVAIPNGYGASNAAAMFEQAMSLYYGYTDLQTILESNHAADLNSTYIPD